MKVQEPSIWRTALISALLGSLITGIAFSILQPRPAEAQAGATLSGLIFQAGGRRDTDKNETYVFFDPTKGEIWFYRDEKCEKHLKVVAMGEPLQSLK